MKMIISESKRDTYLSKISNGSAAVFSDVSGEKGGSGDELRPHELLCAGLASCLNITTRMVLERENIKYEKVIVKVDLDKQDNLSKFTYDIDIKGEINEKVKEEVILRVKNCPVSKTLVGSIEVERVKKVK